MSKVNMIHHVNVQITNRERTREWYEKVLGCEFLDRGPALNRRMLQLRIGNGEIHTSEVDEVIQIPRVHFAVEVEDWDAALANLDALGVSYSRSAGGAFMGTGGDDPQQGQREDTNEHYTYIADPDGNLIELVKHPLGLKSTDGDSVELHRDAANPKWVQIPGFVEEAYTEAEVTV
jgi:catechol 2,3-dioxygenase-like lactoylglutathione lyase family enzyme